MAIVTEGAHTGEFLMAASEDGFRSFDYVTYDQNQTITVGMLIAKQTRGALTIAAGVAASGNAGNGTASAPSIAAGALAGTYKAVAISATKFEVFDPNNVLIERATAGTAFTSASIGFTLTAGGTPWAAGDEWTWAVTEAAAAGRWTRLNLSAVDGTQILAGIAYESVTTGAGVYTKSVAVTRAAEVNGNLLTYSAAASGPQIAAQQVALTGLGIIVR